MVVRSDQDRPPRLLTIPPEVRDHILEYVLVSETSVMELPVAYTYLTQTEEQCVRDYRALFATCRELRESARSRFFGANIFTHRLDWSLRSAKVTREIGRLRAGFRYIKHIAISVPCWFEGMPGNTLKGAVLDLRLKDAVDVQAKVHVLEARNFDDFEATVSDVLRAPEQISPSAATEDTGYQTSGRRLAAGGRPHGGTIQLLRDDVDSAWTPP
ncbi:hypothetical protein LTR17_002560 [Elasticomyces elasticus]|nr:hypothetical protein LTR17_002560 [Elasticomyces elasticus]